MWWPGGGVSCRLHIGKEPTAHCGTVNTDWLVQPRRCKVASAGVAGFPGATVTATPPSSNFTHAPCGHLRSLERLQCNGLTGSKSG
jgi:hypothetical protein